MTKILTFIARIKNWKNSGYEPLGGKGYYKQFRFDDTQNDDTIKKAIFKEMSLADKKIIEEAYKKAWECRNYEIDKYWSRSAYFWGFLALTFTAYMVVITSDSFSKLHDQHLDLYIILFGIILAFAWLLVIAGSKAWQDNWERHIDKLEDFVSGPLYKTVFCSTEYQYFSLAKVNESIASVTILVWIALFFNKYSISFYSISLEITIPVIVTFIIIIGMIWYSAGNYKLIDNSCINDEGLTEYIRNQQGDFARRD